MVERVTSNDKVVSSILAVGKLYLLSVARALFSSFIAKIHRRDRIQPLKPIRRLPNPVPKVCVRLRESQGKTTMIIRREQQRQQREGKDGDKQSWPVMTSINVYLPVISSQNQIRCFRIFFEKGWN